MRSYINLTKVFLNPLNKSCESLFQSVKRKSERVYYSSKNNAKKIWGVMKELIGKIRNTESSLPKTFFIEKNKYITEIKDIAEEFNDFFTNVGPNLVKKVPYSSNSFNSFLNQTHSIMEKKLANNKRVKGGFILIKN